MARPPMPIGTYGAINVAAGPANRDGVVRFKAEAYFRDFSGVRRRVARYGDTGPKARRALQTALAELVEGRDSGGGPAGGLTGASRFRDAAEVWLADVARQRADSTADNYRQRYESVVRPVLGELRLREITVGRLDGFMAGLQLRGCRSPRGATSARCSPARWARPWAPCRRSARPDAGRRRSRGSRPRP
jgi:Phage integrase, N-terminal SAM-like domain